MKNVEHKRRMNGQVKGISLSGKAGEALDRIFGMPVVVDERVPRGQVRLALTIRDRLGNCPRQGPCFCTGACRG